MEGYRVPPSFVCSVELSSFRTLDKGTEFPVLEEQDVAGLAVSNSHSL